jgi:hypothetical protein
MRKVGIWIDHRKAVLAAIENGEESLRTLEADVGRHAGPSGGSRTATPWGPQAPNDEHARERRYEQHLVRFYHDVIQAAGRPDQLLVMGPAQAKHELAEEIAESPLKAVPLTVETVDEMTDAQVAARLRNFEPK